MYICTCIYIYMYNYIHIHVHVYIYIYIYMYTYIIHYRHGSSQSGALSRELQAPWPTISCVV